MRLRIIMLMNLVLFFQNMFCQEKKTGDKAKNKTENKIENKDTIHKPIASFEDGRLKAYKLIDGLIQNKVIPGVSISVTKKGHTIWEEGYGCADIEKQKPIDPKNTIFRIASVSKSISAAGLAKMQELNMIDWNCSLYDYVEDFPRKEQGDFTIKQLGGHLAGIRPYKGREVFSNKPMTIEAGLSMFKDDPLLFVPGTSYQYTSYDWNLVGVAMEKASRMSFDEFMHKFVFDPIGMTKTSADVGYMLRDYAIPYTKGKYHFNRATQVHNYYKLPGGGFLSTSHDVAKFGNAILSGKFLRSDVQWEMLSSQCLTSGQETGYGIGWQASVDWKGRNYNGHIGNGIGGYSWFYVYPKEEVVIVMCFNVTNPSMDETLREIIDDILEGAAFVKFEDNNYQEEYFYTNNSQQGIVRDISKVVGM